MVPMIDWEHFDRLHVIRRLRQIIGQWWGVQINFTDEKGFIRGVPAGCFFNPLNPSCRAITAKKDGFKSCVEAIRSITAAGVSRPVLAYGECHAGFSTISVPIEVNGQFLGAVIGDGFMTKESFANQKVQIANTLSRLGVEEEQREQFLREIPVLDKDDIRYLSELIEMVVDELLLSYANLDAAEREVKSLQEELANRHASILGQSEGVTRLVKLIASVGPSQATVLIQGENGTGKELVAKAIHDNSARASKKMVTVNCGSFNENLLESELFGHVKGAFTGASASRKGVFEEANESTLFLDEVGDTPPAMQVKLLRVLESGEYIPVGSNEVKKTNARVICATNRDLQKMVESGAFREDLFYRLSTIMMMVPPLRERGNDIQLLADNFLARFSQDKAKKLSPECLKVLLNYGWPGNVRELKNEIERLVVLSGEDEVVSEEYLSPRILQKKDATEPLLGEQVTLKEALEKVEIALITEGLKRTRWNKSKLAKELGISRASLIAKVSKYSLE